MGFIIYGRPVPNINNLIKKYFVHIFFPEFHQIFRDIQMHLRKMIQPKQSATQPSIDFGKIDQDLGIDFNDLIDLDNYGLILKPEKGADDPQQHNDVPTTTLHSELKL